MEMVKNAESRFRDPVISSSQRISTFDVPPPTTLTPAATLSTPSSPPSSTEQTEDVYSPRSPNHRSIENTFPALIRNPDSKCSVTLLANLPASEGLQKTIQAKEELSVERNQIIGERDQLAKCLLALEARLAQMGELEAQLEQSEKEKMVHNQQDTQLHTKLEELKVKWVELQDVVTVAAERESASMEQINKLKANLHSKIEEVAATQEKRARVEERLKKVMEQNHEHARTNIDLCWTYEIVRIKNDQLQSKI
ncbi:uncharacterized protein [Nicotiana tomentosiformis]|uniref:uncharacterized protein n=1 Tax=Nicotiana tomentosiformis TaxID=4098 RepID=UPI00388C853D